MKKIIAVVLSAVIAASSATISMAEITFSDINNVPWDGAKNYVTKVAELGLMVGEENGDGTSLFRPKDKVTYCETVQLAYNILKNEGKTESSQATTAKWKSVMSGYKIPEWAHEAVSYALEKQMISVTDLAGFMTTNGANNNATREDVAVIFGRALSSEYEIKDNPVLTFADKDKIFSSSAPYVNLLSELNILVGDDDENFNPKSLINRAEMAVVTTKTYSVVSGEKVNTDGSSATGTIITVLDNDGVRTITMTLSDGTKLVLNGDKSTPTTYNGKEVSFTGLTAGDNVTVDYINDTITNVVVNFDFINESSDSVTGTINYMTSEKITVNLEKGGTAIYPLATNVSISLNDGTATISRITKMIDNGVTVDVVIKLSNGTVTAVSASGLENTVQGTITKISSKDITIKRTGGTAKIYSIADSVTVKYEGETSRINKIIDVFDDSTELYITATLDDDNDIKKMVIKVSQLGGSVTGYLKKVTDEKIVVAISDTETKTYSIAEDPKVTYEDEDITYSKLVDKFEDGNTFTATVYLNSNKKVSKIEAKIEDNDTGVITNLTDTYITIFTSAGVSRRCLLDKDVVIKFNGGTTESISYLKSIYETGKTGVTLTFNKKDEVVKILVDLDQDSYDRISGEIVKMGSDSIKIGTKTVYSSSKTVVKIDDNESTWALLYKGWQSGETYDATVIFADNIVKNINAELTGASGKVYSLKYGEIKLNTDAGTRTYAIADDEDLNIRIDDTKTSYDFNDFYSLWYVSKNDYSVILTIEEGQVVRINATTL
ncbi:MAG: S-layer homology domain-containing protein [Lachnospiraceae bacterium]|nr:S-layer homology domain-containing protein [Lachnospiraceae bacterium]